MNLSNGIKQRFTKDFKLPINIFSEPYFTYQVELYDDIFKVKEKIKLLEEAIQVAGGEEEFFQYGSNVAKRMKEKIAATQAYQNFNKVDMNKEFPLIENIKQQNIYIYPNINKELISIDLEKANFNCLDLFNIKNELKVSSYDDLMKSITEVEYFTKSKMIRQVIFGDLNPSRQQRLQKYIINQLCIKLRENGYELSSASSDEIIISNASNVKHVQLLLEDVPEKFKFFRVEKFKFKNIDNDGKYFIKTTETQNGEKIEFKSVPGHLFAQVYKKHLGLEINDYDMLFYHDGFLAQFKEPLFSKELSKKPKP